MNILTLEAASVAGNVTTTFECPTNGKWKILYGYVTLTTDATIANRWVRMGPFEADGTTKNLCLCAGKEVVASQTGVEFSFMQGIYRETAFINNVIQVPIASDLIVVGGELLKVLIENGVAGDAYSVRIKIRDMGSRAL